MFNITKALTTFSKSSVLVLTLAAGSLFATAQSSQAASAYQLSCTIDGTTFTLDPASARDCVAGNDTPLITSTYEIFGHTGWILAQKNEYEQNETPGDDKITWDPAPVNNTKGGSWGLSLPIPIDVSEIFITLKASNEFGAFLLNSGHLSGSWSASKDLSHASIYYRPYRTGDTPPVPVPATLPLLLGALGGAAVIARRRKAA